MLLYFSIMWTGTFLGCRRAGMRYADAVVQVRSHVTIGEGHYRSCMAVAAVSRGAEPYCCRVLGAMLDRRCVVVISKH